jgi:hypothetical protein
LLIMGTLAWAYLAFREFNMRRHITARLNTEGAVPETSRATLSYYRDAGLLYAKRQVEPAGIEIFARLPENSGERRYFYGGGEGSFLIPFDIDPAQITPPGATRAAPDGLVVMAHVGYVGANAAGAATQPATQAAAATQAATTGPTTVPYYGPFVMSPEERQKMMAGVTGPTVDPTIGIEVLDARQESIVSAQPVGMVKTLELTRKDELSRVGAIIPPTHTESLKGRIYLRVTGQTPNTEYFIEPENPKAPPVALALPLGQGKFDPIPPVGSASDPSKPAPPTFVARSGSFGQQLRGGRDHAPVAVVRFHGADVRPSGGQVPFEFRAGIERSGSDAPDSPDYAGPTEVAVRILDRTTNRLSDEVIVRPESNRTLFFTVPASAVQGGDFDVHLRCLTVGDFLGLGPRSVVLITQTQPFAWNLFKSMLILWLMSILITTVAIFTSTFLSWPIAVVLTLVILLGHWGVQQLGDAIQPGIGAQVVTDFGLKDPAKSRAVQETVEKLSWFLTAVSTVLPDISKFAAVEDIERGVSIPWLKLRESLMVTFGFGLPLVLLSYVFLKNKEVAP